MGRGGEALDKASLQTRLSQVFARLILGLCGGEVVFQEALQVLKSGTFFWVLFPAMDHELVQRDGAVLWTGHPVTAFHLLQHLPVVHACKDKGSESCESQHSWALGTMGSRP
jgi:hypothetical protein